MSNLSNAQIASFDKFAADVREWFDDHSVQRGENKHFLRMNREEFNKVFRITSRLSELAPVMNNVTALSEKGCTKLQFQKRTPEGQLCYYPSGKPMLSKMHCRMYTAEAYRAMRTERTGLKTPETVYYIAWDEVDAKVKNGLATKFPKATDSSPDFEPKALAMVLRAGRKPKKGEKRYQWAAFDFVVVGTYDEQQVIVTQAAVIRKPYLPQLSEYLGTECPDYPSRSQEPKQEELPLSNAASTLASAVEVEDVQF